MLAPRGAGRFFGAFAIAFWLAAACAPVATPTATPATAAAATRQVPASPAPTEPLDPEGRTVDWTTYRSDLLGITFEYPRSSITQGALPKCAPQALDRTIYVDRLAIGGDAEKSLPPGSPLTADAAADAYVQAGSGVNVDSRGPVTVGGRVGVGVTYHSGGLNRFGNAVFVANAAHIYRFAWDAGVFECEPARGFSGPQVYAHVIGSIRFLP